MVTVAQEGEPEVQRRKFRAPHTGRLSKDSLHDRTLAAGGRSCASGAHALTYFFLIGASTREAGVASAQKTTPAGQVRNTERAHIHKHRHARNEFPRLLTDHRTRVHVFARSSLGTQPPGRTSSYHSPQAREREFLHARETCPRSLVLPRHNPWSSSE